MFEYRWNLPSPDPAHRLCLRIHARDSWIGPKELLLDDGQVYHRGFFSGIDHVLPHPADAGRSLILRAAPEPDGLHWRPRLTLDGEVILETTGTPPPYVPNRPGIISIKVGVTYLLILMLFVMLPHISSVLDAGFGHGDGRMFVIDVLNPQGGVEPALSRERLPAGRVGEPYRAGITVTGAAEPIGWKKTGGKLPAGIAFDESTATFVGSPKRTGESIVEIEMTDAAGHAVSRPYVLEVTDVQSHDPRIETTTLPPATMNTPYHATIQAVGGVAPLVWSASKARLPKGLTFTTKDEAHRIIEISGTPIEKKSHPIRFRVSDSAYTSWQDITPWVAPAFATSLCLLGFWNMRRSSTYLFAALILAQIMYGMLANHPAFSWTATLVQLGLLAIALSGFSRMK